MSLRTVQDARLPAGVGRDDLLNRFRLVRDGEGSLGAALALRSPAGDIIGEVTWLPERPGSESLNAVMPLMIASFAVFGLLGVQARRSFKRSNRKLHAAARTIDGYADPLRRSEARFRDVAEASSDWIWECDREMRLALVPDHFAEVSCHGAGWSSDPSPKPLASAAPRKDCEGYASILADLPIVAFA